MTSNNPLLEHYEVPPLDKINIGHFEPAIDHAIEEATKKFAALKDNTSPPDFQNTVVQVDRLFSDIGRIKAVLGRFTSSKYNDALIAAEEHLSKKISAFTKSVYQDETLAKRFKKVAEPVSEEDKILYKKVSQAFESNGAFLSPEGQKRIKDIDEKLISLTSTFMDNVNKSTKKQAVLFTKKEDIAGLPDDVVSALRKNAVESAHVYGWMVIPERLQVDMLLDVAESRNFRQKVFEALNAVGTKPPYNNESIIKEIQSLRHERATLLEYKDYAAFALSRNMAGTVPRATAFMDAVAKKALPKFEENVRTVQAFAAANDGPRKLEPWDLPYWTNRYKEKTFGFEEKKFSEYLALDNAVDGFFKTAERVFEITFHENKTYPRLNEDERTYDVTNKSGEHVGILYTDFFARDDSKQGGAWMSQLQDKLPGKPNIVTLNMNLMKPSEGKTPLLSIEDMSTLFHEGGHALHGLLGTNSVHPSLHGANASSDYIEFFSTVMENWPNQKEVLKSFARHYKTGEQLPDELFEAMERSRIFGSERQALKVLQNSRRDFAFHTNDPAKYTISKELEKAADFDHEFSDHIRSYPLNRWSHLFSDPLSDYAAGYYGYLWSQGLAAAGYEPFENKNDPFDHDASQRLTKLYSYGVSHDMDGAFTEYLGKKLTPEIMADALIHSIGADIPGRVSQSGNLRTAIG